MILAPHPRVQVQGAERKTNRLKDFGGEGEPAGTDRILKRADPLLRPSVQLDLGL